MRCADFQPPTAIRAYRSSGAKYRTVEEAPVEEAPPVEEVAATHVEGAPVEEASPLEEVAAIRVERAPVEEATRVKEAPGHRSPLDTSRRNLLESPLRKHCNH
ncbi:hypothetical protein R1sor_008755 [Riccia sorocarpa]|uniref:Uncharacterized protein n=1 Tax=Riccia sorocarpa TaxID=122646 RepID=A0ABD3I0J0_9MARC